MSKTRSFSLHHGTARVPLRGKFRRSPIGNSSMTANSSHRFTLTSYLIAFAIGLGLSSPGRLAVAQNLFGMVVLLLATFTSTRPTEPVQPSPLDWMIQGDWRLTAVATSLRPTTVRATSDEFAPNGTRSTFASGLTPVSLAFNSSGDLFVASQGSIYEFVPNGTRSTFVSGLTDPSGLAFSSSGDLFFGDDDYIYECTPSGYLQTVALIGKVRH